MKALENIVQFARGLGVFFLVLHVYWYCYEWLSLCGLTYGYADRILLDIQRTTLLFSSPVITKLCAFGKHSWGICWSVFPCQSLR